MHDKTIRLLHVEDDPVQQRLIPIHLRKLPEFHFHVTQATSADEAIKIFQSDGADLVLLDYHLSEGNGLAVLVRIRELDSLVPVIALSGKATSEVAAELIRAGADDFIQKSERIADKLTQSVRSALLRCALIRQRQAARQQRKEHLGEQLAEVCAALVDGPCAELEKRLDDLEQRARQENLSCQELTRLFQTVCEAYDHARPGERTSGWRRLRPLWLELRERLFGSQVVSGTNPSLNGN